MIGCLCDTLDLPSLTTIRLGYGVFCGDDSDDRIIGDCIYKNSVRMVGRERI